MRNHYDLLKIFAIFLVIIGHITILYGGNSFTLAENRVLTLICSIIYLFHMPLFIALSGSIYQISIEKGKYTKFSHFLKNKIFRICIPFITVGSLFLAPTLTFLKMTNGMNFTETVFNILGCLGIEKHLWYLPALFWIFIIAWTLHKINKNIKIFFPISVLTALFSSLFVDFNFMCISNGIHYLPYFLFGMIIQIYKCENNRKILFCNVLFMILIGCIIRFTSINWLDNILSILLPCTIITILLPISKQVFPFVKNNKLLITILNNSFAIYLFHVMIIFLLYSTIGKNIPTLLMIPLAFILSICGSILIAYILRKLHLQIILGEKV